MNRERKFLSRGTCNRDLRSRDGDRRRKLTYLLSRVFDLGSCEVAIWRDISSCSSGVSSPSRRTATVTRESRWRKRWKTLEIVRRERNRRRRGAPVSGDREAEPYAELSGPSKAEFCLQGILMRVENILKF